MTSAPPAEIAVLSQGRAAVFEEPLGPAGVRVRERPRSGAGPGVWALGRVIESQLYDVKPTDPPTIAAVTLLLCATALIAALIPARRASAVNPADALRLE